MARSTGLHGPLITFNLPRKSEKFAPRLVKDVLLKKKFDQKETPNFLPKFLNENKVYYCTYCLMNAMVPLNSPSQSFTRFINPHVFYPTTGLYVYFYQAFHELRRYHTRPLRLNWGPGNVHFGKRHFWDLNINVRIFIYF